MEERIILGEYIMVILRRWKFVLAMLIVTMVATAIVSFIILPPTYEATTSVVATTPRHEVSLETRIQSSIAVDILSRDMNNTLYALVQSPALEEKVQQSLSSLLSPDEMEEGGLLKGVEFYHPRDTGVIEITARANSPLKAMTIANTWAEAYQGTINRLYGVPEDLRDLVNTELQETWQEYDAITAELTRLQTESGVGLAQGSSMGAYDHYGTFGKELETKDHTLAGYLAALDNLQLLIDEAEALREQGRSGSAALPLDILQTGPLLNHDLSAIEEAWRSGDLAALIEALYLKKQSLSLTADKLTADIEQLREQLALTWEQIRLVNMEQTWASEVIVMLGRKKKDVDIAAGLEDSWVQVIHPAPLPDEPTSPRPLLNLAVAMVLGLALGTVGALLLEYNGRTRSALRRAA
ncbi:MAG: hypothetical protein H8D43_02750 [Chloroflexi bacterium]|nr:hypothetical protein [Chloroflexota bacterium]